MSEQKKIQRLLNDDNKATLNIILETAIQESHQNLFDETNKGLENNIAALKTGKQNQLPEKNADVK